LAKQTPDDRRFLSMPAAIHRCRLSKLPAADERVITKQAPQPETPDA